MKKLKDTLKLDDETEKMLEEQKEKQKSEQKQEPELNENDFEDQYPKKKKTRKAP